MFSYVVRQALCILNVCFVMGSADCRLGDKVSACLPQRGCLLLDDWEDGCLGNGGAPVYPRHASRGLAGMRFLSSDKAVYTCLPSLYLWLLDHCRSTVFDEWEIISSTCCIHV